MSRSWDWTCGACADGEEDSCERPEHCSKSLEKKREAAEALFDRLKEEGKLPPK
ncbi:MAG: hypothetical protein Q7S83_01545 [bacterium]|nr:hypothetical protein [bacterium]